MSPGSDKKRWKEDSQKLDELLQEVRLYRNPDDFRKVLRFIKQFPRMAPFNALLVYQQKPGCYYFASAREWKERFSRTVKPSATPLVILRPFGPVGFVFDVADTEGDPVPESLVDPFRTAGTLDEHVLSDLITRLTRYGVYCDGGDYGPACAGRIMPSKRSNRPGVDLVYNRNQPPEQQFATIIHELGHLFCGHLGGSRETVGLPGRGSSGQEIWRNRMLKSRQVREFEAESVAWLVCGRMGIENPSADYLASYSNQGEDIPSISLETVLKATGIAEGMVSGDIPFSFTREERQERQMKKRRQRAFQILALGSRGN